MNQAQKLIIERYQQPIVEGINYTELKTFLLLKNAVVKAVFQKIEKDETTEQLQNLALLEVLKKTDKGWEFIHQHFNSNNQTYLSNLLGQTTEMTQNEIDEFVLHLQARLVKEYTRSVHSPLSLFQASRYEAFNDSTYVTIEMIRQEQESLNDRQVKMEERSAGPEKRFGRISGNTELLSVIYSENTAMLVPFIIFGQPGQGKTTFVQKLVYDWAMSHKEEKSNDAFHQISLLFAFQLRNLKGDFKNILDFLLERYDMTPANIVGLKEWINRNPHKVLVILDGYDEVSYKCDELEKILNERMLPIPPRFPLIVTTRPYAMTKTQLRFQICELTKTQVSEFVGKRAAGYPGKVVNELVRFCHAEENAFLLSSPLLLHLLCWVALSRRPNWDERTRLDLPGSQTQTYAAIMELLSKRRNETREDKGEVLSVQAMIKSDFIGALSAFAFNKLYESQEASLIFDRIEAEAFNGVDVTKEAMTLGLFDSDAPFFSGAFALCSVENLKLSFPHKTFQEFFAAIHIVRRFDKDKAALLRRSADFLTSKKSTAKSLRLLLGDDEDGENDHEDALKPHRQILLFAIGFAWITGSPAANTLLQLVCSRILGMIRKYVTEYANAEFILSLLKALSRERSESGRKELMLWAKANTVDIERFASKYMRSTYSSYTVDPSKGALSPQIDFLLHLGVGNSSFRSVEIDRLNNALVVPFSDGEFLFVGEFAMPAELIRKAEKREGETIEATHFLFEGTISNLDTFFGAVAVSTSDAQVVIYPKGISNSHDERYKQKTMRTKSVFKRIDLRLSSQLGASEVRSVFEVISRSECVLGHDSKTVSDMNFFFADDCVGALQVDDEDKTPAGELQEITSISAERLNLGFFTDSAIPTRSTFEGTLACLWEIDTIRIGERALPLLDEWFISRQSQDRHRQLPHVRYIEFHAYSWASFPGVSLATFVRDVKAQHLWISLPDENPSKESFSVFCNALLETEENESHCKQGKITPLQKLTIGVSPNLTDKSVLLLCDQLVVLLRSSEKLHLETVEYQDRRKLFDSVCSALPSNLRSRVKGRRL